jgi:M6 family metalloprotease-like protein
MQARPTTVLALALSLVALASSPALALEPPTPEQLARYRADGTLPDRVAAARGFSNHRMAPQLAARVRPGAATAKAQPDAPKLLPATGAPEVLTLLVAFADMPGVTDPGVVNDRIFGDGEPASFPYESLTEFYRRSSYDQLAISGSVLGWYTTPYPRGDVDESYVGRQSLIKEVISHFDLEGHDFARYDNDGDGFIDYLAVVWTGPHGEWAEFWWGYQTSFWNDGFTVDGVRIGTYSWQWENYTWPGEFSPEVLIHETGHALGLPDYYDYDDGIGPRGGLGGLDQMDSNLGDHNCFSKWVLGWIEPEVYNQDAHEIGLLPSAEAGEAAVLMHGNPVTDPAAEYFMVQVRNQGGNDLELPGKGVLIWHVDARVDGNGDPLYDNSYTEHKLLRLMEADGLEEIEQGGQADAGDLYSPGDLFDDDTIPDSKRYDGGATNLAIHDLGTGGVSEMMIFTADLGSGCALWCDASVSATGWPGEPVAFTGSLETANCDGVASYGWDFGDGATSGETNASHSYVSAGSFGWSVTAELEDATCSHDGTVLICTDLRCWQWADAAPLAAPRAQHAAVALADGRILVVGGGTRSAELWDPATGTWAAAAAPIGAAGMVRAALLLDGRVLVVGSSPGQDVDSEIYDPATDTWSVTGQLNHDRTGHSALALSDGRVLVAGGEWSSSPHDGEVREVEIFDPASQTWSVVGSLAGRRFYPGMANLADGRAVIAGGRELTLFDPASDTLRRAAPLPADWQMPVTVALDDGRLLLAGIANAPMTLLWNPVDGRWTIAGPTGTIRQGATATKLGNGLVLVAGGFDYSGVPLEGTELFDPAAMTWSAGSSLGVARGFHTATLGADGRLLVVGGAVSQTSAIAGVEALVRPTTPPRSSGRRLVP